MGSQSEDAALFAAGYGLEPYPWQARILDSWLGETDDGRWASPRVGLAVPRQNGKNAVLEIRELYGMVALGEKFLHTAHEVKTARKAFLRLASFFDNPRQWPELAALVEGKPRKTNGQEAIQLKNGGSVEFVARSRGSGRGFTVDVLVCDEAQELTDEQLEALLPTISSAPLGNPQILLTGTPPPPGTLGEVFVRTRRDALAGTDPRLAWHEWSVDGEFDIDDRNVWAEMNPSLGRRIQMDVVETERAALSEDGFARERLGSWKQVGGAAVISSEIWEADTDGLSRALDPVSFAVDVTPDRDSGAIGMAGRRPDGLAHVEVVDHRKGTGWIVDRVAELNKRWHPSAVVVDVGGPAGALLPDLEAAGVTVTKVSGREMAAACGGFYDLAVDRRLRHIGQPSLNSAVGAARKRNLGDSWAWHRRDLTDISPLVAVTLALFGHVSSKPPEFAPRRIR